jgi:hypothetical protein
LSIESTYGKAKAAAVAAAPRLRNRRRLRPEGVVGGREFMEVLKALTGGALRVNAGPVALLKRHGA